MVVQDLKRRVEQLEEQVAKIQSTLVANGTARKKDWRRAVEKYAGDADLLAVFAEAKKLRNAERKEARQDRTRRSKT